MRIAHQASPSIPAYLIADQRAVSAYGLGMIRPGARDVSAFVAEGYVVRAASLRELATQLGIDPDALEDSAQRIRRYAKEGVDPEFQRGTTLYERNLGDPTFAPNPTLGPLANAPYYAVRLFPGDIGASSGLVTDEHARVLDAAGQPIRGLYAVGNDMHSVMAGTYPGPGITLGPAAAFAYLAMEDALGPTVADHSKEAHVAAA
jgi:succinate dehydrogenase/fumarate reductase flavoprotein subunit